MKVSKRSEVLYINGAPSTPGYLLALLRVLSHVPRGQAGTKNEPKWYFVPVQTKGPKVDPHVSNLNLVDVFCEGLYSTMEDWPLKHDPSELAQLWY